MRRFGRVVWMLALLGFGLAAVGCSSPTAESARQGDLEIRQTTLSFTATSQNETDVQRLELENIANPTSGGDIRLRDFIIDQGESDPFREFVPADSESFPVEGRSVSLAPGESVTWKIRYEPENQTDDTGRLTFEVENSRGYANQRAEVMLEGKVLGPCLETSPKNAVDFGRIAVDETTFVTFRMRNCRDDDTRVFVQEIDIRNDSDGVFGLGQNTAPGKSTLLDDDLETGLSVGYDETFSLRLTATPSADRRFGRASCDPAQDPVVRVTHNGWRADDDVTTLCLTVEGDPGP